MLKVILITLTLMLMVNGFLTEALNVAAREGHASWIRDAMNQMVEQGKLLFNTAMGLL